MDPRKDDLNETLSRLGAVLAREVETWEQKTRADRTRIMEQVSKKLEQAMLPKEERRALQRREREERKAAKRAARREKASVAGGVFGLAIAAVFIWFAVTQPQFWWMVFIALGIGSEGIQSLVLAQEKQRLQLGEGPIVEGSATAVRGSAGVAPQRHEVDVLCDQLLQDLKASPEAVKAFVQKPEQTVESLRKTAKALDARRLQLAREDAPGHLAGLAGQRESLTARRDAAQDPQARNRLEGALRSLEGQEAALKQLLLAAERVEGEYTSLLVALQELRTKVAVARSTTSAPQLGSLEQSVQRLNVELEAITESLQATQASPFTAVDAPAPEGSPGGAGRTRERG